MAADDQQPTQQPINVVVQVVTPEVVNRLEAENQLLRQELKQIRDKHEALHRTVYRLMDVISDLRKGRS